MGRWWRERNRAGDANMPGATMGDREGCSAQAQRAREGFRGDVASELSPKARAPVSQHEDNAHTALTVNESAFHCSSLKYLSYALDLDAFKLWCWRRLLQVPWTARRSNQSILREINPEYLLERLTLKL